MKEEIERIGKVSSISVKKHTGKNWNQWIHILEKNGAQNWLYPEITKLLREKYKLSQWWQQNIAMCFEIYTGKRVLGRNSKGEYSAAISKTIPANSKSLWAFLISDKGMELWLKPFSPFAWKPKQAFEVDGGIFGEVRTVKPEKRLRFTWQDPRFLKPSTVQIFVIKRAGKKCMVAIQHEKIPTQAIKSELAKRWKMALSELQLFMAEIALNQPS